MSFDENNENACGIRDFERVSQGRNSNARDGTDGGESYGFNCSWLESLPRPVKDIISWRCPLVTGSVMAGWLVLSLMVRTLSFVSVVAYIGLFFIVSSMLLRFYCSFVNTEAGHPLQELLDRDVHVYLVRVSQLVHRQTASDDSELHVVIAYLRDIFLLNNYTDALKFFFVNLALVYVGMCFNLVDLLLLLALALLTGPKVYSLYRKEIDAAAINARAQLERAVQMAREKVAHLPIVGGAAKPKQL